MEVTHRSPGEGEEADYRGGTAEEEERTKKDFIQKEKRQTEFIYSINKTLLY